MGDDGVGSVRVEMTRDQILDEYYEYWATKMKETNQEHLIDEDHCVLDWCILHWASEVEDYGETEGQKIHGG